MCIPIIPHVQSVLALIVLHVPSNWILQLQQILSLLSVATALEPVDPMKEHYPYGLTCIGCVLKTVPRTHIPQSPISPKIHTMIVWIQLVKLKVIPVTHMIQIVHNTCNHFMTANGILITKTVLNVEQILMKQITLPIDPLFVEIAIVIVLINITTENTHWNLILIGNA